MKKILTGALTALTVLGATAAATVPADAAPHGWHGGYHGGWHRGYGGGAVAAGIIGLGLGAALAGGSYYGPPGYYYGGPAYYGYGGCHTEWRWSYRWGHYERVAVCY